MEPSEIKTDNGSSGMKDNQANVEAAFEMLLSEIDAEIEYVNALGAQAFEKRDYEKVQEAWKLAEAIGSFREKVEAFRREWDSLKNSRGRHKAVTVGGGRRHQGRLRKGERTPQEAYFRPILEAVRELGGSARVSQVLDLVLEKMRDVLRDVDYEPVPSNRDIPRWKNTAQWARSQLVKKGYLRGDSPRNRWEITDEGIRFLEEGHW